MSGGRTTDGTVGKALDVLDLVAGFKRPVRFSELLDSTPYPKATLYRLMQTLVRQGLLRFDSERQTYQLGVRLVRLAHAAWQQSSLAPVARPHVEALARRTGETVHVAQLDHGLVLYVDKQNAAEPIEMYAQAGKVGPAYCTGVGKAMLAHLGEDQLADAIAEQSFKIHTPTTLRNATALRAELKAIRARGFAQDREEHEAGIICIAMPVLSGAGHPLGAISLTTSTARKSMADLEALLPELRNAVRAIEEDARAWHFPEAERRETVLRETG